MKRFVRRIYLLGFVFAILTGLGTFLAHYYLEARLHDEIKRNVEFKLDYIIERITSDLAQVENTLNAAQSLIQIERDDEKIHQFFQRVLKHNESYISIYLGTPENKSIYANDWVPPSDLIDVRTRPWYVAAVKERKLVFTAPYLDAAEERLVITLAQPVYGDSGELLCVVGVDKSLQGMHDLLGAEKASEHGHSFVFDPEGRIVMCPHCGFDVEARSIADNFDLEDDSLWLQPRGIIRTTFLEGQTGYLRWESIARLGLIVATFAPLSDFIDKAALNTQLFAMTTLSFLTAFYFLLVFQRRYIIRPMSELDADITAISVDDFAYRLPVAKKHFFGSIRETINLSLGKAQEYFENVLRQQEELEAAYEQLVVHEEQLQAQYNKIKQHEAQIQYFADHDPLTGLLNRRKFTENLSNILEAGGAGAVLMLDIDNFKNINDIQGHVYGDKVLQIVAGMLKNNLYDEAVAYRFGGDEFLVLVEGNDEPEDLNPLLETLVRCLEETYADDGRRVHLTLSIGAVRFPEDAATVDELLIKADIAMHNAKKRGKGSYQFFQGSMAATFSEKVHIENFLIETLDEGNFMLVYQPIVETFTGEIAYFEALIRIRGHSISPAVFIPIAEESNLIFTIGRWVMKEALQQLVEWKKSGKEVKPISINLSPRQFYDEELPDFLVQQLDENDIDPKLIEIEITETVFIDNAQEAIEIIERIKGLGIKICLDDFGTGYSSINFITRIPVDRVKLDRSLTEQLGENTSVMEGLVAMAHGLNMDVVGEGVETFEEARLLMRVGCDYLQGFLFSVPVPPEKAERILHANYSELLGL